MVVEAARTEGESATGAGGDPAASASRPVAARGTMAIAAPARPRNSSRRCTVFRGVDRMGIGASSVELLLTRSSPRHQHSMTAPPAPAIRPEAEDGHTFVGYAARA